MTVEQYNKAAELFGKIDEIQATLRFFSVEEEYACPYEPYVADGHGNSCPIPPNIVKSVLELIETEYCKQIEELKKELEEL